MTPFEIRTESDIADDAWARVELYRWQHGDLPGAKEKPLSVPAGLRGMAEAIRKGDLANFPAPFNVVCVLQYAARIIEEAHYRE